MYGSWADKIKMKRFITTLLKSIKIWTNDFPFGLLKFQFSITAFDLFISRGRAFQKLDHHEYENALDFHFKLKTRESFNTDQVRCCRRRPPPFPYRFMLSHDLFYIFVTGASSGSWLRKYYGFTTVWKKKNLWSV